MARPKKFDKALDRNFLISVSDALGLSTSQVNSFLDKVHISGSVYRNEVNLSKIFNVFGGRTGLQSLPSGMRAVDALKNLMIQRNIVSAGGDKRAKLLLDALIGGMDTTEARQYVQEATNREISEAQRVAGEMAAKNQRLAAKQQTRSQISELGSREKIARLQGDTRAEKYFGSQKARLQGLGAGAINAAADAIDARESVKFAKSRNGLIGQWLKLYDPDEADKWRLGISDLTDDSFGSNDFLKTQISNKLSQNRSSKVQSQTDRKLRQESIKAQRENTKALNLMGKSVSGVWKGLGGLQKLGIAGYAASAFLTPFNMAYAGNEKAIQSVIGQENLVGLRRLSSAQAGKIVNLAGREGIGKEEILSYIDKLGSAISLMKYGRNKDMIKSFAMAGVSIDHRNETIESIFRKFAEAYQKHPDKREEIAALLGHNANLAAFLENHGAEISDGYKGDSGDIFGGRDSLAKRNERNRSARLKAWDRRQERLYSNGSALDWWHAVANDTIGKAFGWKGAYAGIGEEKAVGDISFGDFDAMSPAQANNAYRYGDSALRRRMREIGIVGTKVRSVFADKIDENYRRTQAAAVCGVDLPNADVGPTMSNANGGGDVNNNLSGMTINVYTSASTMSGVGEDAASTLARSISDYFNSKRGD